MSEDELAAWASEVIADWPETTDEQRNTSVRILSSVRRANNLMKASPRTLVRRAA